MTIAEVDRVCFVGAGTMGCANSLAAAVSGYEATLVDVSADALGAVEDRQREMGEFMTATGYCGPDELQAGRRRITKTTDLEAALAGADLISESVLERLDLKREVHGRLDRICDPTAILTTNTSGLLVSDIEDVVERGDRFAALHTHLGSLLVDIVGGPRTSRQTIDTLRAYVLSLGATPLVLKREHPGYVVNALLGPLMTAALDLHVERGFAPSLVDRAWMTDRSAPIGPFGLIDLFGLDLLLDGLSRREAEAQADPGSADRVHRVVPVLRAHVDAGRLGVKSGAGFYTYPDPAFQRASPTESLDAEEVATAITALTDTLVDAAHALVDADVVEPEQVDEAWTVATGLSEGPLAMGRRRDRRQAPNDERTVAGAREETP